MANRSGEQLAKNVRQAAKKAGMSVEEFRRAKGLPNTSFYKVLRAELVKGEVLEQLDKAGVRIPAGLRGLLPAPKTGDSAAA